MPAVHFALLGTIFFVAEQWRASDIVGPVTIAEWGAAQPRPTLLVSAVRVTRSQRALQTLLGRPLSAEEKRNVVNSIVDDELLYHEAMARGLDRDDKSVTLRLVGKARFLFGDQLDDQALYQRAIELGLDQDDPVIRNILVNKLRLMARFVPLDEPLSDARLLEYLSAHRERYEQPARLGLGQMFFSRQQRGENARDDAMAALAELRGQTARMGVVDQIANATSSGDAFVWGLGSGLHTEAQLAKILGRSFARVVAALDPGEWTGPHESAYGYHLVRVVEKQPSALPVLESVRSRVEMALREELRDARIRKMMDQLSTRYDVRVVEADSASELNGKPGAWSG